MESLQPAPDGQRVAGYDANVRFWQTMIVNPDVSFEVEERAACGERAIIRVRCSFGRERGRSVRGVILLKVRGGRIVEALAYGKTDLR
jgi:SnoaL-like protein